jgi:hypothetical protein
LVQLARLTVDFGFPFTILGMDAAEPANLSQDIVHFLLDLLRTRSFVRIWADHLVDKAHNMTDAPENFVLFLTGVLNKRVHPALYLS